MSRGRSGPTATKTFTLRAMLAAAWFSVLLPILAALPVEAVASSPGADAFGRVDVYICTAQAQAPTLPTQAEGPHCPLCVLQGGGGAILPTDAAVVVAAPVQTVVTLSPGRGGGVAHPHPAPPPPLRGPPHFV